MIKGITTFSKGHIASKKGFTLIELLVVIAIIGILAGIVLASLGTARNKGKDSTVQEQLSSARSQGEIFYTAGNTYASVCSTAASANGLAGLLLASAKGNALGDISPALVVTANAGAYNKVSCHDSASAWAAEAPLTGSVTGSGLAKMWCVDSTGASKAETDAMLAGATACL